MPDLQNFAITILGAANVNIPRAQISARLVDSQTGVLLSDFTGANALNWPGVLTTLTVAQRRYLIDQLANTILLMRAGLWADPGG